jgi:hypothetical protein
MNKKKKFQRSDIPYKDRLLMRKHQEIAAHREDAARIALKIACVALNDTEGLGFIRINRFADRLHELLREYYADPDLEEVHLNTRLEQMGFLINREGHMIALRDAVTGQPITVQEAKRMEAAKDEK